MHSKRGKDECSAVALQRRTERQEGSGNDAIKTLFPVFCTKERKNGRISLADTEVSTSSPKKNRGQRVTKARGNGDREWSNHKV